MATQTTGNLKLSKPDGTDKVKEFRAPYNSNLDKIDEAVSAQSQQIATLGQQIDDLETDISLVSDGDTHPAINPDQYIIVKNHSTLTDGLYYNKTESIITASTALTANNLERVEIGGLNHLIATKFKLLRTVTGDGSRTYNSLISELFTGMSEDNDKYLIIMNDSRIFNCTTILGGEFVQFSASDVGMTKMITRIISRQYNGYYEAVGDLNLTAYASIAAPNGATFKLIKIR